MNDTVNGAAQAVDEEDLNTTAPNPPQEWTMPAPVFRKTSGRLPAGFERNYGVADATLEDDPPAADEDNADTSDSYVEPTPRNPTVKLMLVLLGLAAMIAFIAIFLTVVYFLFLR